MITSGNRDADILLKCAAVDDSGALLRADADGGTQISAGNTSFPGTPREVERFGVAVGFLLAHGLVEQTGPSDWHLTRDGWHLADRLPETLAERAGG